MYENNTGIFGSAFSLPSVVTPCLKKHNGFTRDPWMRWLLCFALYISGLKGIRKRSVCWMYMGVEFTGCSGWTDRGHWAETTWTVNRLLRCNAEPSLLVSDRRSSCSKLHWLYDALAPANQPDCQYYFTSLQFCNCKHGTAKVKVR